MKWPAIYIQESRDDELMYISSSDWNQDVDSRYAIGPLNGETDHYLVDSEENVCRLSSPYMNNNGYPHFEFENVELPEIVDLVKVRAKNQLGKVPERFSDLVKKLDY